MAGAEPAAAQGSEPFLGQLTLFPYTFCPRGWTEANGQLLPIAQNTALFSLIGTTYGGNGQTTFALPDLRGRAPIHVGTGPGLSSYTLGQVGGAEQTTITVNNMPPHNHSISATNMQANKGGPGGKLLAADSSLNKYSDTPAPNVAMNPQMVGTSGGGQPISIRDPYLAMRWCIALEGIFPSRN
ncbi:tail fiber protein [Sphingobium sp. BYY-5]|uniref:phage tail protein n=1 Tax=Sphingobium sp. BYY-5 TaxID=2926400 RepID=UPI001FA6AE07|nr:tail fiber protein [Sphingobium sp. BYY-5]MCI4590585.1 tail fiber protein [Sphingobium sp. BYY-5]